MVGVDEAKGGGVVGAKRRVFVDWGRRGRGVGGWMGDEGMVM